MTRATPKAPTALPPVGSAAAPAHSDETRSRLLHAAGEVFAEVGFRRATVRDICARAGANVAAINYHFGDKEGLYAEVVKSGIALGLQKYPADMDVPEGATAEQRLRGFVRSFLYRTLGRGDHACSGRIMLWEMVEPTPVLDAVYRERIRHLYGGLERIVRDLLGPAATPALVRMGCASILGQCSFYRLGESLLSKIQQGPTSNLTPEQIEALADHVTRFSVAGLRAYASGQKGGRP
jgi:AcrR family transcriptional regulator